MRLAITLIVLSSQLLLPTQDHSSGHWQYDGAEGPSHWADLNPDFTVCRSGHHQSPIDIRNAHKADLPPIQLDYKPSPLHIIDNGHTVMINYAPGSFLRVGDKQFALKQFHFHHPSEERINGKAYDMSLHLVHADDQGNLAVVAVLLERGADNPLVDELWSDLPRKKDQEEHLDNVQINAKDLLPSDLAYYTFPGSLTTPPCTENVIWFVLEKPVTVSSAELQRFEKLYRLNARPTEPLYDRVVMKSK